jgi:signal transduction histidine kinase
MSVTVHGHRRRMALALLVAGIPCLLLFVLAWRMLEQERELERTRERERRVQFAADLGERMRQRLERVRLQLPAGITPDPVPDLVALRKGASLRLPWQSAESFSPWPESFAVRSAIEAGEREELIAGNFAAASRHYQRALERSRRPDEAAYARLLLARALSHAGRPEEALENYRSVAALGPDLRDDLQIPLALYAMERLSAAGGTDLDGAMLEPYLQPSVELPPTALHLLEGIAKGIDAPSESIARRLHRIERGTQLARHINAVLPPGMLEERVDRWIPYGDWLWLVGTTTIEGEEAVIAVAAEDLVRSMVRDDPSLQGLALTHGWEKGVASAGTAFPGLGLRLPPLAPAPDQTAVERRNFLFAALAFVILSSLIAAGLLLRDVRRETELAQLRSQFVSSVSHELKTPLSAIRMFAESLQMQRPSSSKQRDEYLDVIVNESERLSRLLDNVLEFSKIERGERRYRLEPRDLAEVVGAAMRAAAYPLQQKGFHVAIYIEENLPPVRVDEDALEQALLNLLTNAMKYSGESRDLQVRVERAGDHVAVRVIDHGIGVPPQEKEKIFEKFYRATNSEGVTGAGLGLAIVAHIARSHGGSLHLESSPGGGSEFTLAFPSEAG